MRWMRLKLAGIVLAACVMVPAYAQHRDQYVYEKLHDEEQHLDHTDGLVAQNDKTLMELREQIESYKDYALGFAGCFTLFVGILKFLGRKEEQSA